MNSSNTKADLNGQKVSLFPNKEQSMTAFAATINTTGNGADASMLSRLLEEKIAAANYWEQRCKAAEAYINEVPCDPDITAGQIETYAAWKKFHNQIINNEKS